MKTQVRLNFTRQVSIAEGHEFGATGPYVRLVGTVHFALDPNDTANQSVVDLDKAPRNQDGLVEFSADVDILKPVDFSRGNRRVLYDIVNRGVKTVLRDFNDAPAEPDPTTLTHMGNGFLMRHGYTVVWSGWQGDLVPRNGMPSADLPEALEQGQRLRGTVRQEFIADQNGVFCLPVSGDPAIRCYEALLLDTNRASLTRREREGDAREPLGQEDWAFATAETDPSTGKIVAVPSRSHCYVVDGFRPGWIYELIHETEGSRVIGLGLVGIRDLVSLLRYEAEDDGGIRNRLSGYVEKAYAYGASLSARVLRQFIYEGYNVDTSGRRVFDGAYPHVSGGGRLFANTRFAQVGRFPRQHEEHQWPSERYPFAYGRVPDSFSEDVDSVLKRPESDPLVVHTHTSTEYWQRHGSLGHTDPRSGDDLPTPEMVRMYVLSSAQHAGNRPPVEDVGQQIPNTMAISPFFRALLVFLDRWASEGQAPPPSKVPLRSEGTLSSPETVLARFPKIPGLKLPTSPSHLPRYDYGPEFHRGLVTEHPPRAVPGQEYPVQVPQVDADGNEVGGLRSPEIEAPVGTHTGWGLRRAGFAEGELFGLSGSFAPFPRSRAEGEAAGDPRQSIEERYGTHAGYVRAIARAAEWLVAEEFLLEEDAERYVEAAMKRDPLDPQVMLKPLDLDAG